MGLLEEIDRRLDHTVLHAGDVEDCAMALLIEAYPGLTPIAGGWDFGRDADIEGTGSEAPPRLLVTSGDPRANLTSGLESLKTNGLKTDSVVIATTRSVSARKHKNLQDLARTYGVTKVVLYARPWWKAQLYRHPEWRKRLLHLAGDPPPLVTVPLDLLDDPWGELKLAGRASLVARLAELTGVVGGGDVILSGGPALGKTRVAVDLPGAVFLERCDPAAVADQLRRDQPGLVVVDDAHLRLDALALLRRCRESENLPFRILALTWPDAAETVAEALPGATSLTIGQLEQGEINEIVEAMGVTSYYLRHQIITQAQGRPGWAVTLTALAAAGAIDSLSNGAELTRQVQTYLRRRSRSDDTLDVLAAIAAAGTVSQDRMRALAETVQLRTPEVTGIVHAAARSGLLDRDWQGWHVRPEELRGALISSWFFGDEMRRGFDEVNEGLGGPDGLWDALAAAAEMGTGEARAMLAAHLANQRTSGDPPPWPLLRRFAGFDREAATWATAWAREIAAERPGEMRSGPVADIYTAAANIFLVQDAIKGLLDLAQLSIQQLPAERIPELQTVMRLCRRVLPDIGLIPGARPAVLHSALDWLHECPTTQRWDIVARVMRAVLDPELRGIWVDPGSAEIATVASGIEPAATIEMIARDLWPRILRALHAAPPRSLVEVIGGIEDLLRAAQIGVGLEPLPADIAAAARHAAVNALVDIARLIVLIGPDHPGLAARVNQTARWFAVDVTVPVDADFALLTTLITDEAHWEQAHAEHRRAVAGLAARWAAQDPDDVVATLTEWVPEMGLLSGITEDWTAGTLSQLAQLANNPTAWANALVSHRLARWGQDLLTASVDRDPDGAQHWLRTALADPELRPWAMPAVLRADAPPTAVIDSLQAGDAGAVFSAIRFRRNFDTVAAQLLTHPMPAVRVATALACRHGTDVDGPAVPASEHPGWCAAVSLPPDTLPQELGWLRREHERLQREEAPEALVDWILREVRDAGDDAVALETRSAERRDRLSQLPASLRERLAHGVAATPSAPIILRDVLRGDTDLARRLLEDHTLNVEQVLTAFRSRPGGLRQLLPALISSGASHASVANAALPSSWAGSESSMWENAAELFADWAADGDADVAAVGRVGRLRCDAAASEAAEREHQQRVRGL